MKRIAILGSEGRMGLEIKALLVESKIDFVAIPKDKIEANKIFSSAHSPKLIIDFSSPDGFDFALKLAIKFKIPIVSGTTGLSALQFKKIKRAGSKIPIFWSANTSVGIAILKKALESFSHLKDFDFQIEEFHHRRKQDRPSGTAKVLNEKLSSIIAKKAPDPLVMRAGGLYGTHKVYAVSDEELLCFEHQALNRRVFARGAVRASLWLIQQKPGFYSMEDLLGE